MKKFLLGVIGLTAAAGAAAAVTVQQLDKRGHLDELKNEFKKAWNEAKEQLEKEKKAATKKIS